MKTIDERSVQKGEGVRSLIVAVVLFIVAASILLYGLQRVSAAELGVRIVDSGNHITVEFPLRGLGVAPSVETTTSGTFRMVYDPDNRTWIWFLVEVLNGRQITQVHLHCARPGQIGPAIVTLFGFVPGGFDSNGVLARFNLSDANISFAAQTCAPSIRTISDLIEEIERGSVYVSVRSVEYPNGLLRGQMPFVVSSAGDSNSRVSLPESVVATSAPALTNQANQREVLLDLSKALSSLYSVISGFFQ